ncbi:hypothetical protein UPYG_G00237180 [Umbra pygmaea]|uniref:G-protein coupled receptors family 1 profile domain-containing protein n=1 Tax=Umbra pygmaea TaxID=75934 RepID=A0ABD0WEK0_UMBPY
MAARRTERTSEGEHLESKGYKIKGKHQRLQDLKKQRIESLVYSGLFSVSLLSEDFKLITAMSNDRLSPNSFDQILLNATEDSNSIVNDSPSTTAGALILLTVFLFGFPGNLFIIWSVLLRARRRSVTTLLILNLAVADGLLMSITPFFVVFLFKRSWVFGLAMCKIIFYMCVANMYTSIHLIMLMSLHRLVVVVWPRRVAALVGRKRILRGVLVLWILVLVASIPPLLFRGLKYHNDTNRQKCESIHQKWNDTVIQYTLETVLGFIVPYTVIVASYICILKRIKKTRFQRRMRSEKLILTIVITFGLFWLPYHVINIVQIAASLYPEDSATHTRLDRIGRSIRTPASTLAFISSCVNPILYTFAGKSYIRKNGLAFMARLFEGTGNDSGTRKSQQNSQNSREREKDAEGVDLKEMNGELESTSSATSKAVSPITLNPLKNDS